MTGSSQKIPPVEEDREAILHRLGERVKELTALHSMARIFQQSKPIDELLQAITVILPPAWQYPGITTARVVFDGREHRTRNFSEGAWSQRAGFVTVNGKQGFIEVFYTEATPPEAEGPFLAEERHLIESLAEMLRIYLDRRIAEDALLESEERFRITFEQAAVGIVHVGMDGHLLRANQKFCDIMGYAYTELLGQTLKSITCVHDVGPEMEYCEKLMANRIHAYSFEKRNIRKDGKHVWVNETASLVRGRSGEPRYFIFVLEDVTERKASESERRRLVHDLQERVKELTAMYQTMETLQQQKPVPELLREVVSILPAAWQYPEIAAARIRFDDKDYVTPNYKESQWRQVAGFRTYDAYDGLIEVIYLEERPEEAEGPFLAEERDLIESLASALKGSLNRIKAQTAVADSENLYHTLADAAHDMVYIKDVDGRFTYFNDYAGDILGEDPEEYIGKKNKDLYAPEAAARHDAHELRMRKTGKPVYFEEITPFPRNSLWTANWLVPVKGEEGKETPVMCVVRDIDGRKRAEQTLLQVEKELESMCRLMGQTQDELNDCIATLERRVSMGNDAASLARVAEELKKCSIALKGFRAK